MDICGITPRDLSDEEKQNYSSIMANACPVIRSAAERFGLSVRKFRSGFFKGKFDATAAETNAVQAIKQIDTPVLEGYCRLVPKVARKFFNAESQVKRAVQFDDYIQEGVCAISDAMFEYNGKTQFPTYATWAVHNRLIDYIRSDNSFSPIKRRILRLRTKITKLMDKGKSFDEAADELNVPHADREECLASFVRVVNAPESGWDFPLSDYSFTSEHVDRERVAQALELAPLSDFERAILTAHINGDKLSPIAKDYQKTRMAGTYALRRALDLVRDTFNMLEAKFAA